MLAGKVQLHICISQTVIANAAACSEIDRLTGNMLILVNLRFQSSQFSFCIQLVTGIGTQIPVRYRDGSVHGCIEKMVCACAGSFGIQVCDECPEIFFINSFVPCITAICILGQPASKHLRGQFSSGAVRKIVDDMRIGQLVQLFCLFLNLWIVCQNSGPYIELLFFQIQTGVAGGDSVVNSGDDFRGIQGVSLFRRNDYILIRLVFNPGVSRRRHGGFLELREGCDQGVQLFLTVGDGVFRSIIMFFLDLSGPEKEILPAQKLLYGAV